MNDLISNKKIISGLKKLGIDSLSEIQKASIKRIKDGEDLIINSSTGSGKTLAYLIPIIDKIDLNEEGIFALILLPTYELVYQVRDELDSLLKESKIDINVQALAGNANIKRQLVSLRDKPRIVLASTGRILELIQSKKIKMHTVKIIVLDEGDRLLDKRNFSDVEKVVKSTLLERQVLTLSASTNQKYEKHAKTLMKNPSIIRVSTNVLDRIEHFYIEDDERKKFNNLRTLINTYPDKKIIVFENNISIINDISAKLDFHNIKNDIIFGALDHESRKNYMQNFINGKTNILISSDLLARGLDIDGVDFVVNFDLPQSAEFYLNRAGRTARMYNEGTVISLINKKQKSDLKKIEKELQINLQKTDIKDIKK